MKIGIMGGTFDPIHYGHLILSQYVLDSLNLDKVIFIPSGMPPHKDEDVVLKAEKRKKMVELAIKSNPKFKVSSIEIEEESTSYTIETVKKLKNLYKDDKLYLILGGDSLLTLHEWKDYKEILKTINIAVVDRYNYSYSLLDSRVEYFNRRCNGNIVKVSCPIIQISSTDIRKRVKEGRSIKYLLPEEIEDYIYEKNLYR